MKSDIELVTARGKLEEFNEEDPLQGVKEDEEKTKTKSLFRDAYDNISVEPSIMLFIVSMILIFITSTNVYLEKACRVNLNYTQDICDRLKNRDTEGLLVYEQGVQKLTASAMNWRVSIVATLPCILAIFVGGFQDKSGLQKFFITVPIAGSILSCISDLLNIYFYDLRLEVLVFSEAIIDGITGNLCITILSVFSYISTNTSKSNRTYRMGITSFCMTVAFPIGMGLSGVLIRKGGYYVSYGVPLCLQTINLIYTVFFLKEQERTTEQKQVTGKGFCPLLRTFFDFTSLRDTFRIVAKHGWKLRILLLATSLLFGTLHGEISVVYLLTRYRYNWNEINFSIFQTYNFVLHTIGTLFSILVFSKLLKWHDSMLGIISTASKVVSSIVFCFAFNEIIFYVAPVIEILNGTALVAARAMTSKIVAPDELGKINALIALAENLMPLLYVPIYTKVYMWTFETATGVVFIVTGVIMFICLIIYSWLFHCHRKEQNKMRNVESDAAN